MHRFRLPLHHHVQIRHSIPIFAMANMEIVVDALHDCWSDENPKRYESVTAWAYVQMRMAELYES